MYRYVRIYYWPECVCQGLEIWCCHWCWRLDCWRCPDHFLLHSLLCLHHLHFHQPFHLQQFMNPNMVKSSSLTHCLIKLNNAKKNYPNNQIFPWVLGFWNLRVSANLLNPPFGSYKSRSFLLEKSIIILTLKFGLYDPWTSQVVSFSTKVNWSSF